MLHSLYRRNSIVERRRYKIANQEEEQGIAAEVQQDIDTFLANRPVFIERLCDHLAFYNQHHDTGFTYDMRRQAEKILAHILRSCPNQDPIIVSDQFYSTSTDSGMMDDSPVQSEQEHGEHAVIVEPIDNAPESREANLQPGLSHEYEVALPGPSCTVSKGVYNEMAVTCVIEPSLKRQHDTLEDICPTTKRRREIDNEDAVQEGSHQSDVCVIPAGPSQVVVQCREEQMHEPAGPRSVDVHRDNVLPAVNVEEVPAVPGATEGGGFTGNPLLAAVTAPCYRAWRAVIVADERSDEEQFNPNTNQYPEGEIPYAKKMFHQQLENYLKKVLPPPFKPTHIGVVSFVDKDYKYRRAWMCDFKECVSKDTYLCDNLPDWIVLQKSTAETKTTILRRNKKRLKRSRHS